MAISSLSFILILLSVFNFGYCLQCYSCNSEADSLCEDPVSNATLLNNVFCNQRGYGCMKQIVPEIGPISRSTHRGCAPIAFCELLKDVSDHCSVCTTNLCNSSSSLVSSLIMLALSSFPIFLFYNY